jgi:hypothetical protein
MSDHGPYSDFLVLAVVGLVFHTRHINARPGWLIW